MTPVGPPDATTHPLLYAQYSATPLTEEDKAGLARGEWFRNTSFGYFQVQSTKPQSIGYSMADSPVGLLGWLHEKLHLWTDSYPWTDDEILTWVSIYWFSTAGPAASQRIYYENMQHNPPQMQACGAYIDVKLGIGRFPKELVVVPKLWYQAMGPVVYIGDHSSTGGGHFAAWERPQSIVSDLRAMLGKDGGAYGCVEGKDGY